MRTRTEVEFVGYVMNQKGYTLSDERKEAVFQIPRPLVGKHMKSFIGVAQYFRNHIPDFACKIHPLQAMIEKYDRTRVLEWTPEADSSWNSIREDIRQCQTLHFLRHDGSPIFLHTDASDYGIGAYLFQIIDGLEIPIAFMSKTLTAAESRWSATEKECYAFGYAFKKFEYLLRDVHFTLRTDHRNLTYINESVSPKVRRLKLLIQEFDFDLEFIKGSDNHIADAQSRIIAKHDDVEELYAMSEKTGDMRGISRTTKNGTIWSKRAPPDCAFPCASPGASWDVSELLATLVECEDSELQASLEELNGLEDIVYEKGRYALIAKNHNSHIGHFGVEKTLLKILAPPSFDNEFRPKIEPWPHMREMVKKFIRNCPCCQKLSQIKTPIHTRGYTLSSRAPMDRLSVDSIGPLPPDENGMTYMIVIIDTFTRWTQLYAAPNATAKEAVKCLLDFIKTFGQPHELLSDNGGQYASEIVAELILLIGNEHCRIVAHSHEENAIVERVNKEVMRHFKALVFDDKTVAKWSISLAFVQRIINTAIHEAIGCAPYKLLFGAAVELDQAVFMPVTALNISVNHLSKWADESLRLQQQCLTHATAVQDERDRAHMLERNKQTKLTVHEPDSWVKARYPRSAFSQVAPNKLALSWRGPYQVVARGKGEYELRDPALPKTFFISEHLLDPYHVDTSDVMAHKSPRDVAIQARDMVDIEAILDVRGDPRQRTALQLKIKWSDEESPIWTTWNKTFLHNWVCHKYFMNKGGHWRSLVPKTYKDQMAAQVPANGV